jgi:hypothetical protein
MSGPACPKCGELLPNEALVAQCSNCLNAAYLAHLQERERAFLTLAADPLMDLALARGDRTRHLVLHVDSVFCYCGIRPQGPPKKWLHHRISALPNTICTRCVEVLVGLQAQPAR